MSTIAINKRDWVGTKAQYIALNSIETNRKYYITDLETFVITNSAMASALTTYAGLYNDGDVFLCVDSGTYTANTFYKLNSGAWVELGGVVSSSEKTSWNGKQDALVSGTNIKTINNESLLGSGNITISGSSAVTSVNTKTGAVVLDPDDLDDTNTTNKFVSATEKSTWNGKQDLIDSTHKLDYSLVDNTPTLGTAAACNTGTSSGNVPVLDSNGKLNSSVLPAIAITDTNVVATEAAMLALTAQTGDVCVRSDLNKSFILTAEPASTLANWQELLSPTDAVLSVNSKTGTVVLDADDISDSSTTNKFVTASDKTNWDAKMNSTDPTGTGSLSLNRYASDTIGTNSVAIGVNTTASGENSFAGGKYSIASGNNSFAFGDAPMRSQAPEASGARSFAIGRRAVASGVGAKAMGTYIIAQRAYQLAFGKYNIADTTGADGTVIGSYVEIVGNGTGTSARSNARTLDWDGNEWLAGKITPAGGISDGNNANYELQIPDTTSWTADKTIATTDQIPSDYIKTSQSSGQMITATATDTPLNLKGNSGSAYLGFKNSSGGTLGYIGVNSSQKPVFYDTADHQLAYSSDIPTKTSQLTNDSGFLTSAPVTSVSGRTGAVSTANLISDMLTGNASYGDKIVAKSMGTTGYIQYQSGLCIMWGRTSYGSSSTNNQTINFPVQNLAGIYSVVVTWQKGDNTTREWNIYGEPTTSNFTVRKNSSSDSSCGWSWIAIGKK